MNITEANNFIKLLNTDKSKSVMLQFEQYKNILKLAINHVFDYSQPIKEVPSSHIFDYFELKVYKITIIVGFAIVRENGVLQKKERFKVFSDLNKEAVQLHQTCSFLNEDDSNCEKLTFEHLVERIQKIKDEHSILMNEHKLIQEKKENCIQIKRELSNSSFNEKTKIKLNKEQNYDLELKNLTKEQLELITDWLKDN